MFENEIQTRCAICGTGILLGVVFFLAQFPVILLVVPVAVLFLGLVADPEETHAVWYGMLNVLCIFDFSSLTSAEQENYAVKKHYFWFGEVGMAAILAGLIAVPAGFYLAGRVDASLAVIGAAVIFLPLFVFIPKVIRYWKNVDSDAVIEAFGKNEQVKKVFWTVFLGMASVVLVQIAGPEMAQHVIETITGEM
jgi:F0F1-type ATP synthase assembly protein I